MTFSKKFRAASFGAAREAIAADDQVPNFVADAVRELAAHAPHLGKNTEAGEIDDAELEVSVSGHADSSNFSVNISVAIVPTGATKTAKAR